MRKTIYQCNLCEQQWEEDYVFGVSMDGDEVVLVEAEDSEKHTRRLHDHRRRSEKRRTSRGPGHPPEHPACCH